jgi:hypothetical protein
MFSERDITALVLLMTCIAVVVLTIIIFQKNEQISDLQQYVEAGCHGRYQGR